MHPGRRWIAGTQVAVAVPASWFYDEPRLQPVIMCLAVGTLITGFENIGVVAFRKDLHFRKDFNLSFAKKLVMFVITIPIALILRSYWALVIGQSRPVDGDRAHLRGADVPAAALAVGAA